MDKTKVIFRADGNSKIGLGHVIRSLALAEMVKDKFDCVFAIQNPDVEIVKQIKTICSAVIYLPACSNKADLKNELNPYLFGNEIVVLDGYLFDTDYQRHIKKMGTRLICIDDIKAYHFVAHAIINTAGTLQKSDYSVEGYTQCYLGPQYALLRSVFLNSAKKDKPAFATRKVFVNMGGADPFNDTIKTVSYLTAFEYFDEINIVTGAAFQFRNQLYNLIKQDVRIKHYSSLDALQMAQLMHKCGIAICPPSGVAFEYASIRGLLFLKQIADNQVEVKKYFIEQGLAFDFENDFTQIVSSEQKINDALHHVVDKQMAVLDGQSDQRLRRLFHRQEALLQISLRRACSDDVMITFNWANDPEVRRSSYNPNPITLEDHTNWFAKKIKAPNTFYYIVEVNSTPIGQIRFDGEDEVVISYLIDIEMRGKGLASLILEKGVETLLNDCQSIHSIIGYVKNENVASCKAFEKAGFALSSDKEIPYPDSVKYEIVIN